MLYEYFLLVMISRVSAMCQLLRRIVVFIFALDPTTTALLLYYYCTTTTDRLINIFSWPCTAQAAAVMYANVLLLQHEHYNRFGCRAALPSSKVHNNAPE